MTFDRLSDLPESLLLHILSFLPVPFAARLALLSRRFRYLPGAVPALFLESQGSSRHFAAALSRRDPNAALLHLSLAALPYHFFPPQPLATVRTLHLYGISRPYDNGLDTFLCSLPALEELHLAPCDGQRDVDISDAAGARLRQLRLDLAFEWPALVRARCPRLERLELRCAGPVKRFLGEMPVLRVAVVQMRDVWTRHARALGDVFRCISTVSELSLCVADGPFSVDLINLLVEQDRNLPTFQNLRSLRLVSCFCDINVEGLIALLHKCPALQHFKLTNTMPQGNMIEYVRKAWALKLPHASGPCSSACFSDLESQEKKQELINLLRSG